MIPRNTFCAAALAAALFGLTAHSPAHAQTDAPATPDTTTTAPATPDTSTPIPATPPATPVMPDSTIPPPPTSTTVSVPENTSSEPSDHHSSRFRIGPSVGVYLPTDSKTRDRFGSSWFSLGLGFGDISAVKSQGQLGLDLSLEYQEHDDNHIFLLPLGLGYRIALSKDPAAKTIPYAGISGDVVLADVRSVPDDVHSGLRAGGGGSVMLGLNFGKNANIEARYQFISRIKSFDFSGLNLTAGYRF